MGGRTKTTQDPVAIVRYPQARVLSASYHTEPSVQKQQKQQEPAKVGYCVDNNQATLMQRLTAKGKGVLLCCRYNVGNWRAR